jgi:hypothetical protein
MGHLPIFDRKGLSHQGGQPLSGNLYGFPELGMQFMCQLVVNNLHGFSDRPFKVSGLAPFTFVMGPIFPFI